MFVRFATAGFLAVLLCPGLLRVAPAEPQLSETQAADPQTDEPLPAAGGAEPTVEAAQSEFDASYAEFRKQMGELRTLIARFHTAKPAAKPEINVEFDRVVDKTKKIADRLTASTEVLFRADPKNQDAGGMLMMMLFDALQADHYQEAARIAKELLDADYPDKRLYGLAGAAAFCTHDFAQAKILLQKAMQAKMIDKTGEKQFKDSDEYLALWEAEKKLRAAEEQADDLPRVKLTTNKGDIVVELFENEAPNTTANFISLVEKKFYDGTPFHRVIGGFMAQAGDPQGNGNGGPGYTIACECYQPNHRRHFTGSLSMAHTEQRDTGGSQFFLTFAPASHLNGKHTVFGRVIEGMDVLVDLERTGPKQTGPSDKIIKATVLRKRDHVYEPVTQLPAGPK